ncbi:MAG: hypothetical protein V4681_01090 [Patescibacteria group bacterium]
MSDQKQKQEFDSDFGPSNPVNKQAARDHGLRFDSRKKAYVDEDGCLVRDRFGQRL